MKKILVAAIAALLIILGLSFSNSTATAAGPVLKASSVAKAQTADTKARKAWGTSVKHAADDSGYTGDIQVVCESGSRYYLKPGEGTFLGTSKACTLSGVSRIIVAYNQTVYCKNYTPPYENTYFYTGTNYVPSNRTYKCYAQRPL